MNNDVGSLTTISRPEVLFVHTDPLQERPDSVTAIGPTSELIAQHVGVLLAAGAHDVRKHRRHNKPMVFHRGTAEVGDVANNVVNGGRRRNRKRGRKKWNLTVQMVGGGTGRIRVRVGVRGRGRDRDRGRGNDRWNYPCRPSSGPLLLWLQCGC